MALMIMHYVDHMKSPPKDAAFICHLRGRCHAMYLHQSDLDSTCNKTKLLGHVQRKAKRATVTMRQNGWGIDSKRFDNCKFTRIDTTGNSVVDYLICHPESSRRVSYFNVHHRDFPNQTTFQWYSVCAIEKMVLVMMDLYTRVITGRIPLNTCGPWMMYLR